MDKAKQDGGKNINIERKKKWESILAYGKSLSSKYKFTEDDVNKEIAQYRKENNG